MSLSVRDEAARPSRSKLHNPGKTAPDAAGMPPALEGHPADRRQRAEPFESPEHLQEFFQACDALSGPEVEPECGEHLSVIDESRRRGTATS